MDALTRHGTPVTRRRAFALLTMLSGGLVAGCAAVPSLVVATPSPEAGVSTPTPAPMPVPSPTATPTPKLDTPQGVATEYLRRWSAGDYAGMFDLVLPGTPGATDQAEFARRYENVAREATLTDLVATLEANQRPDANVQWYRVVMRTLLVGTIEQRQSLTLVPRGGTWRIQWLPSLIFKDLSGSELVHLFPELTPRGEILDATGMVLAGHGDAVSVGIVSGKLQDEAQTVAALSKLLGMTPEAIRRLYVEAPADSATRIRLLSKKEADPIRAQLAALPGVDVSDTHVRTYPAGTLASAALGYLGDVTDDDLSRLQRAGYQRGDLVGRVGIEAWGEFYLAGGRGGKLAITTRDFQEVETIAQRPARPAGKVMVTLDHRIQSAAEQAFGPNAGALVLAQLGTGILLAVASVPGFDPNSFVLGMTESQWLALSQDAHRPLQNRPTATGYPAGPGAHLVALAAALDRDLLQPDATVTCTGTWTPADGIAPLPCWKAGGHGTLSVLAGLAQGCHVAAYHVGSLLDQRDRRALPDTLRGVGMGQATGIIGLEELQGLVPTPAWKLQKDKQPWSVVDAALLAAGRAPSTATALQLAMLTSAVASGNLVPTPRIVAQATAQDGSILFTPTARQSQALPLTQSSLASVRTAMQSLKSPSKRTSVAGVAAPATGGDTLPNGAWFLGYAPADRPEVAIAVMVEGGPAQMSTATTIAGHVLDQYQAVRG